ncbi:MAG: hypothetical protein H0X47_17485 [Nitrospirales bacterium]|nr:hypothetical protein [Nitrospirales bacterium]
MKSFGEELLHFSQSVDYLTDENVDNIKQMLFNYLKKKADAATIEICVEAPIGNSLGLIYTWYSEANQPPPHPIFHESGKTYYGQTSFAYHNNRSLWIISSVDSELAQADHYMNLLRSPPVDDDEIPPFVDYTGCQGIQTSIILPLIKKGRPHGVFNIEFLQRLKIFDKLKEEIYNIKSAIETLLELEATSSLNRDNTKIAIKRLENISRETSSLRVPSVFIAFAKKHDKKVSDSIARVLNNFFSSEQIVFWNKISESGNINEQILKKISFATYGICYLSENVDNHFKDNPNVLFEAGMLHALANDPLAEPTKWIPIRENAENIPFDFSTERILVVPRNEGVFIEQLFEGELREMLIKMTGITPRD